MLLAEKKGNLPDELKQHNKADVHQESEEKDAEQGEDAKDAEQGEDAKDAEQGEEGEQEKTVLCDLLLRHGMSQHVDYVLVPEGVWELLIDWYGGGPEIRRPVIKLGVYMLPWIDLHPIHLTIQYQINNLRRESMNLTVASCATLKELIFEAAHSSHQGVAPHKCVLQMIEMGDDGKKTSCEFTSKSEEAKLTMEELKVTSATEFIRMESKMGDTFGAGNHGFIGGFNSYPTSSYSIYQPPTSDRGIPPAPGVVGIQNMGNTCFMASALQCLVRIPEIRDFFLYEEHLEASKKRKEIRKGKNADLSKHFASLVEDMWGGEYTSILPAELRRAVGRLNPTFTGFQQHDSQEFVSCLLHGLHEELNMAPMPDLLPDPGSLVNESETSADCAWKAHCATENSRVSASFGGQWESRWSCELCGHTKRRYEPFKLVSLSVPSASTRLIECVLVPIECDAQVKTYKLEVLQNKP